ncbi:MAG: ATP-binding protein, partial [Bacteroidota bacterium]
NYDIDEFNTINKTNDLHIFRIIQELISNSIRHGNAKTINVIIKQSGDFLTIEYKDNGIGFDTEAIDRKAGIGLQNIESRVAILNGSMVIESKPNTGSTFTINCKAYE